MRRTCTPWVRDASQPGLLVLGTQFAEDGGYLLIQTAAPGNVEEWFGADHYVEVNDQANGQYGGIVGLAIGRDSLTLTLSGHADVLGGPLELVFAEPLAAEVVEVLSQIGLGKPELSPEV